jgi:hypothetical protein
MNHPEKKVILGETTKQDQGLSRKIEFYKNGGLKYRGYKKQKKFALFGILKEFNLQYRYIGEFWLGYYNGFGILFSNKNRVIFQGHQQLSRYCGNGVKFNPKNGTIQEKGVFKNDGLQCKNGFLYDDHGFCVYRGGFKDGLYDGKGVEAHGNGKFLRRGEFLRGDYSFGALDFNVSYWQNGQIKW